jgi:hypothetical protein
MEEGEGGGEDEEGDEEGEEGVRKVPVVEVDEEGRG